MDSSLKSLLWLTFVDWRVPFIKYYIIIIWLRFSHFYLFKFFAKIISKIALQIYIYIFFYQIRLKNCKDGTPHWIDLPQTLFCRFALPYKENVLWENQPIFLLNEFFAYLFSKFAWVIFFQKDIRGFSHITKFCQN